MDFQKVTIKDETATIGALGGSPMDIVGFAVGRPGTIQHDHAERALKPNGYTSESISRRLECRGRETSGISSDFLYQIKAQKKTMDLNETIKVDLLSPRWSNQAAFVERIVNYASPQTAPLADELLKSLTEKYGKASWVAGLAIRSSRE